MIGKFANASALLLLSFTISLGAQAFAQTSPASDAPASPAPAAQTPAAQPPSNEQEPAEEESTSRPKKPKDYKNWNYNAGIGASLESGNTRTFAREGGYQGMVGVARNANKYLGLRADFIAADLPLRQSTLSLAQAASASSYMLAVTLGPVINIPVTKLYGGYILFGPGYYRRAGSLNTDTAVPGSSCNAFYEWWGSCSSVSLPLNGTFTSSSVNQAGYFFGAGITRKMPSGAEIFAEFRFNHAKGDNTTTDVRPVTIGVRW
jgi:hypothetical protein